jgi:hypothetical protein
MRAIDDNSALAAQQLYNVRKFQMTARANITSALRRAEERGGSGLYWSAWSCRIACLVKIGINTAPSLEGAGSRVLGTSRLQAAGCDKSP